MRILLYTTEGPFGTEIYTVRINPSIPGHVWRNVYWVNQNFSAEDLFFNNRYAVHYIQNRCLYYQRTTDDELYITFNSHDGDGSHFMN